MAWYEVTYRCGHTGRVQLFGKTTKRYETLDWMSRSVLCDECKQAEFERNNAAAAQKNAAIGLPQLTGSVKQIAWAESLRAGAYNALHVDSAARDLLGIVRTHVESLGLTAQIVKASGLNPETSHALMRQMVARVFAEQTSASWWIDRRPKIRHNGDLYDYDDVTDVIIEMFAEAVKASATAQPVAPVPEKQETKKAQLSRIMKRAWQIARAAAAKLGCALKSVVFGACLKQAWAEARA